MAKMFDGARQSANDRLRQGGMGEFGEDPEMAGPPMGDPMAGGGGDPQAELDMLLSQIDPQLATQISALVAQIAGGPAEPDGAAEMLAEDPIVA